MHLDDIDGFVSVRATAGTCQQKLLLRNRPHAGLERRRPWSVATASRELRQLRPNFNILLKQKKEKRKTLSREFLLFSPSTTSKRIHSQHFNSVPSSSISITPPTHPEPHACHTKPRRQN